MTLILNLPADLDIETLITRLSNSLPVQVAPRQFGLKTYYDSFDWRLYDHGLLAEFNRSNNTAIFSLTDFGGKQLCAAEMQDIPAFYQQFTDAKLRKTLQSVLDIRALLSVCTLDYEYYPLTLLNEDDKTIARLQIEKHKLFNNRLVLTPAKGYAKNTKELKRLLLEAGLVKVEHPLLLDVLKLQGRKPKAYSSRLTIQIAPDMRADVAGKIIYSHLLKTLKANESGTIGAIDSEFLHDFRVAVRRIRSGLSQIKGIFPAKTTARFNNFFTWLGQITSSPRDIDVYLLRIDDYKDSLPAEMRGDLEPLREFLLFKQQQAYRQLAKKLHSQKYRHTLAAWQQFLTEPASTKHATAVCADLPIKELADQRILKVYNRVLKQGNAITPESPGELLHTLRKTCKKLRYLIEFFQNLYPAHQLKPLLKTLKNLQDVLGNHQDYEVQGQQLQAYSEEMMVLGFPLNTFPAIEWLIRILEDRKIEARQHFADSFEQFKDEPHAVLFNTTPL